MGKNTPDHRLGFDNQIFHFFPRVKTDFIQVFIGSYPFPVFNVADSAISVGAVALIVFSLFSGQKSAD